MCMCHDKIHIKGFLIPHEKVLQNIWVDESKLIMSLFFFFFFNILAGKKKKMAAWMRVKAVTRERKEKV